MPSAVSVARALRYATALMLQGVFWTATFWLGLVTIAFILWSALTDKDPGCFILGMTFSLLCFAGIGWLFSRIARGLVAEKRWAVAVAAAGGLVMAAASTYSGFLKPEQNLHHWSNALGFVLWSIVLAVVAMRGGLFAKPD